jgi:predicted metalloprotease with PDZ domain
MCEFITKAQSDFMGGLPYDRYVWHFWVNDMADGSGGVEHASSTHMFIGKGLGPAALMGISHEFFHLWNVKRIRPDALGPFDYENENYTKLLWVAEGLTAYYEGVILRRAGLMSDKEVLGAKAGIITALQARPGRFETSLEEASMDAWIKYYRQDENSVNNQVSYYDKGELVNMLLDLTIRAASNGAKSSDDVLRHLYNDFYKKGRNFSPQDFQKAAEMAAGKSLDDFFAKYVRGEAEIEYDALLNAFGLKVSISQPGKGKAYIGADTAEENGRLNIRGVTAGTPAYDQGLNTGDQIVAIDGYRASTQFLQSYLTEKKPGDKVKLSVFRFEKLREMEFTLGSNDRGDYSIVAVDSPSDTQRKLYREYFKSEL